MTAGPLLLIGAEGDAGAQLLADDMAARGLYFTVADPSLPDADADPDADPPGGRLYADQDSFLAALISGTAAGGPVSVVLRRPGPLVDAAGWADGLLACARAADRRGDVRFLALTPEAAKAAADAGVPGAEVPAPLPGPAFDRRLIARVDAGEGLIRTPRGDLSLAAQNWARLRRRLRLVPDAGTGGDLADLAAFASRPLPSRALSPRPAGQPPVIVAVAMNGVGLGHVTRLLSISQELCRQSPGARVLFWCFSQASGLLAGAGFDVVQRLTARHLGCDYDDWIGWEAAAFRRFLCDHRADAVVVDAAEADPFITRALAAPDLGGTELILIRRALWPEGRDPALLETAQHCSLVLEPGDLAATRDAGPTATRHALLAGYAHVLTTPPVVLDPGTPPLTRAAARRALRLPPWSRRVVLVSLGGEELGADAPLLAEITTAAREARVGLLWAVSPLARAPAPHLVDPAALRRLYPLRPVLPGVDGLITACGYNSVHEALMGTDLPVLLAPKQHDQLDDQPARARHAAAEGLAMALLPETPADRLEVLRAFMADVRRGARTPRPAGENGAADMARLILAECAGTGAA